MPRSSISLWYYILSLCFGWSVSCQHGRKVCHCLFTGDACVVRKHCIRRYVLWFVVYVEFLGHMLFQARTLKNISKISRSYYQEFSQIVRWCTFCVRPLRFGHITTFMQRCKNHVITINVSPLWYNFYYVCGTQRNVRWFNFCSWSATI